MAGQVVNLKKAKRQSARVLVAIDRSSGAARFFDRAVREIETDLGGRRQLSRASRVN